MRLQLGGRETDTSTSAVLEAGREEEEEGSLNPHEEDAKREWGTRLGPPLPRRRVGGA